MSIRKCPDCGCSLDPGEICDCKKKEDAPAGTGASSNHGKISGSSVNSLSDPYWDVKNLLRAKEIIEQSGVMAKDIAPAVANVFPKFNRYLLSQAMAYEKYGTILHPDALRAICEYLGISISAPVVVIEKEPAAKKPENRKLDHKFSFRMKKCDYKILQDRVKADGFASVQAWIYSTIMEKLGVTVV